MAPQRHRRCNSSRRVAVAVWRSDWPPLPDDYTQFLRRGALQGARIGRDVRFFDYSYYGSGIPGDELTVAFAENALDVMESLGATIVDTDTGDVFAYTDDEFTALLYEFRAQIARVPRDAHAYEHANVG